MRFQPLGNTGLKVSELGFGGIPILRLESNEAERIVRHAFDRGINFFDTANAYRDSEAKIGETFAGMRDRVIIATKTMRRDGKGALDNLEQSLRMLRTDYIDLYQFHQVAQENVWETICAPGAHLKFFKRQRKLEKLDFWALLPIVAPWRSS